MADVLTTINSLAGEMKHADKPTKTMLAEAIKNLSNTYEKKKTTYQKSQGTKSTRGRKKSAETL